MQGIPIRERFSAFRLTDRDYEILKYLYDQKFCSLEILYFRFFDQRENRAEALPEKLPAARQRLGILKRAGFIVAQKVYSESKSVYLLSKLGFKVLSERFPKLTYGPPIQKVDFRNYEHDSRVTLVRVALERSEKAIKWYPERRIRIQGFKSKEADVRLPESLIPDAVFLSSKGQRVALEVELSVRKRSRFRAKIEDYEYVMRSSKPLFHKVLFIVGLESLRKELSELISRRPNFIIEDFSHFANSLYPKGTPTDLIEEESHVGEE